MEQMTHRDMCPAATEPTMHRVMFLGVTAPMTRRNWRKQSAVASATPARMTA